MFLYVLIFLIFGYIFIVFYAGSCSDSHLPDSDLILMFEGGNVCLLPEGWTHCFTILFSRWFSITTIKNPLCPTKTKLEVPHQSYIF